MAWFRSLCILLTTIYRLAFRHFLDPCCSALLPFHSFSGAHLCPQSTPRLRNIWNRSVSWRQRLQLEVKLPSRSLICSFFFHVTIQFQMVQQRTSLLSSLLFFFLCRKSRSMILMEKFCSHISLSWNLIDVEVSVN